MVTISWIQTVSFLTNELFHFAFCLIWVCAAVLPVSLERGVLVADVVCVTESRQRHRDEVIFTTQGCTFNITEVKSVRKVCVGTGQPWYLKRRQLDFFSHLLFWNNWHLRYLTPSGDCYLRGGPKGHWPTNSLCESSHEPKCDKRRGSSPSPKPHWSVKPRHCPSCELLRSPEARCEWALKHQVGILRLKMPLGWEAKCLHREVRFILFRHSRQQCQNSNTEWKNSQSQTTHYSTWQSSRPFDRVRIHRDTDMKETGASERGSEENRNCHLYSTNPQQQLPQGGRFI